MALYKRSGIYWMDFTIRGRRVRKSTNQTDKYLAGLVLNDEMAKARTSGVEAILREAPILKELAKDFNKWVEENQKLEPDTRRYYKNGWRLLEGTKLASMRMDAIKNTDCETTVFPGSNYNANTALRTLRRMLSFAKEERRLFGDLPTIELRKEWGRSIAMSQDDALEIDAKMKDGDSRDAFRILRSTGMNPKECFAMRWEYVRFKERLYQNPKGKRESRKRPVPLNLPPFDALGILLRRHLEQGQPSQGWVFSADSESGHMETIHKAFTAARTAANKPETMVLYTARHGVGTDVAAVSSLKTAMELLGHTQSQTAMRYQHPSMEGLAERLAEAKTTGRVQ